MSDTRPDVEHVSMVGETPCVLLSNGETIGCVAWLDSDEEIEENPHVAKFLIAGPDSEGYFYNITLDADPIVLS